MHSDTIFTTGWLIFGAMAVTFVLAQVWRKLPIGIALLAAAVVGAVVAGRGLPIRHLVEGMFTYFDPILIIFTAMVFMRVIDENGSLQSLARDLVALFGRIPFLLTVVITLFVMFPAMLTGITTTSVLTTGALIAPALVAMGVPRDKTATWIAVVSVMGMLAPPVNLIAMLIGQGVDMPYIGFEKPLLAITLPIAIASGFFLGYPSLRHIDTKAALDLLPQTAVRRSRAILYLPLVVVFGLMAGVRLFPEQLPDIGIPLTFVIGTLLALLGSRVDVVKAGYRALKAALPVMGLLAGVGSLLQIMTLTGVRGLLVMAVLSLPATLKYIGLLVSLPLFGGVSAFASGMVFGVPFLLSLLGGGNEVVICAAISVLAGLGDVLPPSAINARFAAQVTGDTAYLTVVRKSLVFVICAAGLALAMIYYATMLSFLTR